MFVRDFSTLPFVTTFVQVLVFSTFTCNNQVYIQGKYIINHGKRVIIIQHTYFSFPYEVEEVLIVAVSDAL